MSGYGSATVVRTNGNRRVVLHADPVILVSPELLQPGAVDEGVWEPHDGGEILTLDSAGKHRYRITRIRDPHSGGYIFERISR